MTALTIASIIAIVLIGLLLVAELVALTILFSRIAKLTQQVRNRMDPIVDQSTQILHKVNDVADTVKTDSQKVADTVTGVADTIAARVGDTSAAMQRATTTTMERLTSPPVLTALALFVGLRAAAVIQRVISWPVMAALTLLAGVPFGLRAWRSFRQSRVTAESARPTLILRSQAEMPEPRVRRRAA